MDSFSPSYPTTNTLPSPPSLVPRSRTSIAVNVVPRAVPVLFLVKIVDALLICSTSSLVMEPRLPDGVARNGSYPYLTLLSPLFPAPRSFERQLARWRRLKIRLGQHLECRRCLAFHSRIWAMLVLRRPLTRSMPLLLVCPVRIVLRHAC